PGRRGARRAVAGRGQPRSRAADQDRVGAAPGGAPGADLSRKDPPPPPPPPPPGLTGRMMRGAARSEGWLPAEEGLRLHYELRGSGSQAVVVPLAVYLAGPLGPLADGQRLIFYDLRGRGRSDAVRDPARIGITHDLTDVEAVRRHFELERMALVGFSYVGGMAAGYAAE